MPIELLRVLISKEFNIPLNIVDDCDAGDLLISWNIYQLYENERYEKSQHNSGSRDDD